MTRIKKMYLPNRPLVAFQAEKSLDLQCPDHRRQQKYDFINFFLYKFCDLTFLLVQSQDKMLTGIGSNDSFRIAFLYWEISWSLLALKQSLAQKVWMKINDYLLICPYLQDFSLHNKFDSLRFDDEDNENVPPQPTFGGFSSRPRKSGPPMPRSQSSATKRDSFGAIVTGQNLAGPPLKLRVNINNLPK